jgi:uncharacterized protein (UPF0371 family)
MEKKGFDNKKYFSAQTKAIIERCNKFSKLYLEIGGKLLFDGHASRVLPGYDGKNKIKLLKKMRGQIEVLYCINSIELQKGNTWSDTGLTLDKLALKETSELKKNGIKILGIVATRFKNQKKAITLKKKLSKKGINLFYTKEIQGYPNNLKKIFGSKGFDSQDWIKTTRKIIIMTGAGANSGKMFTCMNQIYQDDKRGINSGYAKFETFPIWNLPLNHSVNLAYEAATADLGDKNMIDEKHKKAYGIESVNYNRDIENFDLLKKIINEFIPKENYMHSYKSPTDMGINHAKEGIINDKVVQEASKQEILRRYNFFKEKVKIGAVNKNAVKRMKEILKKANLKSD